jgi:putative ABC transport system permease protein
MHLAVVLAAAAATATLTGALLVGDSVRATLRYSFHTRLGNVDRVISARERFFTEDLGRRMQKSGIDTAALLQIGGMVTTGDGTVRVNQLHILGVDDRFFNMSPAGKTPEGFTGGAALVNTALAARLNVTVGRPTEVVLRVDNPAAISRNLVLAPNKNSTIAMRLPVAGVADDSHFGRFSLEANQQEPLNLFVPIAWLQKQIERDGKANLLLISNPSGELTEEILTEILDREWRLEDAEARLVKRGRRVFELSSSRVFLDHSLGSAAFETQSDASRLLTYFVNGIRRGDRMTPYSMVTAADRKGAFDKILPPDMTDDQIVINEWLADDLGANVGDQLTLIYYIPGDWQTLTEARRNFRIRRVIPIEGVAADPDLTPDLPGLSDSENCRDWDPSLPIDLDRIRDKDEAYWDNYHGAPKAFITLAAGQAMWANLYGDLTAVRFQGGASDRDRLAENIRGAIDPSTLGLTLLPVREKGARAMSGGTDFGQLFLGLSMFLIISGILLTWLLFVFSIEGRKQQTGMLLAVGFTAKRIRKIYLLEGLLVALIGALGGTLVALVYTRVLIWSLSNAWQGAIAGMAIQYSSSMQSLSIGFVCGFAIALLAMLRVLHRQMRTSAHTLLSGSESTADSSSGVKKRAWIGWVLSVIFFSAAILLVIMSGSLGGSAMAGAFFGAGILLLVSMMIWIRKALDLMGARPAGSMSSLASLALRNSARSKGRSMAVVAMLACGVFMVVAVGANRKDAGRGAELRTSGTGGFALYAASSVPVARDLDSVKGRDTWGIDSSKLGETSFVNLRVRDGDDASCLNLNRAQEPRILGVSVDELARRGAFSFQEVQKGAHQESPWQLLTQDPGDGAVPAIGDYPTIYWGLGKKIGDTLVYRNRKGEVITLRIVAMMRSSILQGSLIISEKAMARCFPEVEGYRAWLIDTPFDRKSEISAYLTKRMADAGLSVETSIARLALFARMEDTYLSIFLVLGGLGLILGCIGLGLIVVRNLLERQGELAMLRAVGFSRGTLLRMVCYEHIYLLIAGLFAGLICAIVSVAPSIHAAAGQLPFGLLTAMALLIGASGVFWVVIATGVSLRGDILTPLRNE